MEDCNGPMLMLDPRCMSAFPAKVDCPATWSDVPKDQYCGIEGKTKAPARCSYPQGVCRCVHMQYCGGVAPSQLQLMGMTWVCGPPRAPDDCPSAATNGMRCTKNGQTCPYGGCGASTNCICTNGQYKCTTQHWATPP
jgi:hypothetical protein